MNNPNDHRLVNDYLKRFDTAARNLDPSRRTALRAELTSHLREATTPAMSDEQVREVIRGLGAPEEIIAEETSNGFAEPKLDSSSGTRLVRGFLFVLAVVAGISALVVMVPSTIAYLAAPGLIFSAFVWTLGGVLTIACVVFAVAARRYQRGTKPSSR